MPYDVPSQRCHSLKKARWGLYGVGPIWIPAASLPNEQMKEEKNVMRFSRVRLWIAGFVAFLMGFPLSEKALAGSFDYFDSTVDLGLAIADSARGS